MMVRQDKETPVRFNIDSPLWQFVTLCVRYFILNVLFVISIIPIITIGSARTALYSTVFAYCDNEDIDLGREYLRRFRREFATSIAASAIFVALGAAIATSIVLWNATRTNATYVAFPVLIIAAAVLLMTFEYYFPLLARYETSFRNTWKNAMMIPWGAFAKTLMLLSIDVAAAALFIFTNPLRIAFILIGFSWLAYAKSLIFLRAFRQVSTPRDQDRHDSHDYSLPTASLQ
jgi:uncharacterized membrane protein YesL